MPNVANGLALANLREMTTEMYAWSLEADSGWSVHHTLKIKVYVTCSDTYEVK